MTEPYSWHGVVLAGGRSSRMGSDKAALAWNGETLLDRAVRVVGAAVGRERVLVSGGGRAASVPDRVPGLGPIGGIASCVEAFPNGAWALVVPVDMPLLDETLLGMLVRAAGHGTGAVHFGNYELPFALRCDTAAKTLLGDLCARENARERSISAFLRGMGARSLPIADERFFRNVNYPEEWKELVNHERALQ